jgi:gliding motility-associated-like protein
MVNIYAMKKNNTHKEAMPVLGIVKKSTALGLFAGLFTCNMVNAQMVNNGEVKVADRTIMAVYMDYSNGTSGDFINDGETYIFQNRNNDGKVSYTPALNGTTYFEGKQQQLIEGTKQADFQNIIYDNVSALVPFDLTTKISVGKNSDYKNGIINALYENGKMIFLENAAHTSAGDQSFVDGKVEKRGNAGFQFPVGNELFFRPSYHAANGSQGNVYTTQYFYQNSDSQYSHTSKDEDIVTINDKEYWVITQDQGSENIVLSLTLDHDTTPSGFFVQNEETELAIVRWNGTKWVNEHGVLSDDISGEAYSNLLTGTVSGYGIFTMALVKKTDNREKDDLIVYNAVSPNDDGINDTFHIEGIDQYPDNTVEIYNRWGVKVFDAVSYNESDNMFKGYSDGRVTVKRGDKLPTGTYFYILKYNKKGKGQQKAGYLYINNQ